MKKYRLFFLIIFYTLFSTYSFSNQILNTNDWIECGEVFGIKSDQKGFMWFLTNKGIKKYDGKQLINYQINYNGRALSLFPNYNYIFSDSFKGLWEIGRNGLVYKYDTKKDRFSLVYDLSKVLNVDNINLTLIYFDNNDNIWLCDNYKRYVYNTKTRKTQLILSKIDNKTSSIEQISKYRYVTTSDNHIYSFDFKDGKISNIYHKIIKKDIHILYTYYHRQSNNIIFCTKAKGIYLYNLITKELHGIDKSFVNVNINSIQQFNNDNNTVYIATNGSGIYKFDIDKRKLIPVYNNYIQDNYHLSNNVIKDLLIDKNNRIWISVYPHGVLKYSKEKKKYKAFCHSVNDTNSLICDQVNNIIEDSDGDYCFATNNGISIYNKKNNKWTNNLYSTYDNNFFNYAFKSICEIKKGVFLIGGYMLGAFTIKKENLLRQNIDISNIKERIISNDNQINVIYKDGNIIWMGDYDSLIKYDIDNNKVEKIHIDHPLFNICSKDNNTLWLGTINGLYAFDKTTKKKTALKISSGIVSISSIYQANRFTTYIGSYNNGIFVYNNITNKIVNYTSENSSLNSNVICSILPASNGNLVLNTDIGLTYFKRNSGLFINRIQEQELEPGFFNPKASVKTKDSLYIFGSNEGALVIDENFFRERNPESKLYFYDLSILYKDVLPGDKDSPLSTALDDSESLVLSHNQNMFSLKVSSINFNNQSNILYTWKLDGFYNGWSKPSKYDVIRFQNVPPGNYKLRVRAILLDNFHILQEKDLNIKITPPIWRSLGAYLFYVFLIISLVYILFRYFWMRRERNEYNNKISFFINTAHDIKTPLSLIKTPLEEIIKKENLSDEGLSDASIALKNTQLLTNLTSNLIDFEKERFLSIINVTRCNLNDFMKSFVEEFKEFYKNDNIDIYIHDYTDNVEVLIDKEKIKSILRNIMSNAVKYCKERGEINITLSNTNNRWQVKIRDNGVGITDDDQKKLFKYMFRGENATNMKITGSGIGLLYTYKLIKNHLGTITCNSKINVGTTFIFTFPLYHKKYNIIEEKDDINETENKVYNYPVQVKEKSILDINAMLKTKYSIIIAEDNIDMCAFLNNSLYKIYDIRLAYNGQEVLDLVQIKKPDLIISDLMMPVMDGNALCNKIKNNIETCHIPIILLTALSDKEHIIKGLQIKADVFLTKPFDMDILKANISNLIENRQLIISAYSKINQNFAGESLINGPELSVDQEFLIKVVSVVRRNLKKDLNVEILCGLLNMSRTSFYNRIRTITGNSPSDFIRNIKMDEACKLLKTKRYTVSEVAEMVGFNDPKYFTDIFKKYYNETPSNYMKQN